MTNGDSVSLSTLLRGYRTSVGITWTLLAVEVLLLALIPLVLGRTIDALLANNQVAELAEISGLFAALIIIAMARRAYDTRAYGTMRANLCMVLWERSEHKDFSALNAHIEMGRELADFLEEQTPQMLRSAIQLVISITVLSSLAYAFGIAGIIAVLLVFVVYATVHNHFLQLNGEMNALAEEQVETLLSRSEPRTLDLFTRRRSNEVRLSDADSVMYGAVYFVMFTLVLTNLWTASTLPAISAGAIFTIISYSWDLVGASSELPAAFQQWTRLLEVQERINR